VWVSERTHGDAHRVFVTFLSVKDSRSTNRAEPELEPGSVIPNADVLGGGTRDHVRSGETGQRCEDTACSLLAGEAVANADDSRLAVNFDAKLSTGARGCSGRHRAPRWMSVVPLNLYVQQRLQGQCGRELASFGQG
jgi:hypothetical protein